ncbi:unnamed protein product [Ambrosiozyma monospora]|uniref:Unnamed protein product n=1 Tax=Ambrosiozyma monospora TaxID=43982 RepID=A0ACB5T0K8_AMBMO|nr:unnamed protein product [Ambrosiozyma monospora]
MTIRHISGKDIHHITSGQVIIDLTTAVKELLENSLDASSSQVTVTFRNYGLDSLEVSDNGSGIQEDDFDQVCLKHATSKLTYFEDVESVSTLGFRGEALSSLCAISDVAITTSNKKLKPKAYQLTYDTLGHLSSKSLISGKVGTSICVSNIFKNLPVRRMELTKNSKKEFQRALTLLQSYAIINTCVRIMVIHIDSRGKKSVVLSSTGSSMLRNNILSVYGPNGMYGLEPINLEVNLKTRFKLKSTEMKIKFTGFISNCSFGQGRSSSDRQLWFVNNRPVGLPKFSKSVTEVYKTFNHLQYPVIIINLEMDPVYADVNVTPDKRTVLINNERLVIESLKEELNALFTNQDTRIPLNEGAPRKRPSIRSNTLKQFSLESFKLGKSTLTEETESADLTNETSDEELSDSVNSDPSDIVSRKTPPKSTLDAPLFVSEDSQDDDIESTVNKKDTSMIGSSFDGEIYKDNTTNTAGSELLQDDPAKTHHIGEREESTGNHNIDTEEESELPNIEVTSDSIKDDSLDADDLQESGDFRLVPPVNSQECSDNSSLDKEQDGSDGDTDELLLRQSQDPDSGEKLYIKSSGDDGITEAKVEVTRQKISIKGNCNCTTHKDVKVKEDVSSIKRKLKSTYNTNNAKW